MDPHPTKQAQLGQAQRISLLPHAYKRSRFFAVFLICCGLMIAGFAISGVWYNNGGDWLKDSGSFLPKDTAEGEQEDEQKSGGSSEKEESTTSAPEALPPGAVPVTAADLCPPSVGWWMIDNQTPYSPDLQALLGRSVSSSPTEAPLVLVLHTHASEGYLPKGTAYIQGDIGKATYSKEQSQNVLAVGKTLCDTLNKKGITAIHCTVMHDEGGMQGAYGRALESIRFFLEHYPSIRYVIDLHRDAVINEKGEYLKSVFEIDGESVAQVMAVVGSDGGGSECKNWEGNLALALQLGALLNRDGARMCRPLSLRNSTYNQELAPYSLLLEIGTGGNSVEEAKRAAILVGEALASLIRSQ